MVRAFERVAKVRRGGLRERGLRERGLRERGLRERGLRGWRKCGGEV